MSLPVAETLVVLRKFMMLKSKNGTSVKDFMIDVIG